MTPAGTRVTWFVLGVCVGIVLAVVGMAGLASAASRTAPDTVPAQSGTPQNVGANGSGEHDAGVAGTYAMRGLASPATESGVPLTPKRPTAALAGPLYSASATWCAPTPRYCQSWGGDAMLGAVHSFRWGDEPYRVRVTYQGRLAVVTVVSFCACRNRQDAIDLSPAAFSRLAELPLGRIDVEVEVLP